MPKLNWVDSGPLEPHLALLRCDSSSRRAGCVCVCGEGGPGVMAAQVSTSDSSAS